MVREEKKQEKKIKRIIADADTPLESVLIKVQEFDTGSNKRLRGYKQVVLRKMKRDCRIATFWTIINEHTGEVHHHALALRTLRRRVFGWIEDDQYKITLDDKDSHSEFNILIRFLQSQDQLTESGEYYLIDTKNFSDQVADLLKSATNSNRVQELLTLILDWTESDETANTGLIQLATDNPNRSKALTAALNYGRYLKVLNDFRAMIGNYELQEKDYQSFLENNFWLFGTEFCELLEARSLTLGNQLDFPLRRTVDGYLDVIEIKTPLKGNSGFKHDRSRDLYNPSSDIYDAISQQQTYFTALEADRHRISSVFGIDVSKVRGKIIVGRRGNDKEIQKRRETSRGLINVEILCFDDLVDIGQRMIDIMVDENPLLLTNNTNNIANVDDIPF